MRRLAPVIITAREGKVDHATAILGADSAVRGACPDGRKTEPPIVFLINHDTASHP
jgi:hypothetical protein